MVSPTGPLPITATWSPGATGVTPHACTATAYTSISAPASKLTLSGRRYTTCSGTANSSAKAPGRCGLPMWIRPVEHRL